MAHIRPHDMVVLRTISNKNITAGMGGSDLIN